MSRARGPKRHYHVDPESIARAALAIIDTHGLEALNLRDLAKSLGVGTSTLYEFVSGRDDIVMQLTGLLLDEIDTTDMPGESWDETVRRVMHSVNEMALRHPMAFELVALAPENREPMLTHLRRLEQLFAVRGLSAPVFTQIWSVLDAFVTGFALLETKAIKLAKGDEVDGREVASPRVPATEVWSTCSFGRDLEVVIAGLRQTYIRDQATERRNRDRQNPEV